MGKRISELELARRMGEKGREIALLLYDEKLSLERQIKAYKMAAKEISDP